MKHAILFFVTIFLFTGSIIAQDQPPASSNRLYGKVVDAGNKKGIEAASVQFYIYFSDSTGTVTRDSLAGGMLTRANGDFSVENLPSADSIRVEITAIGYQDFQRVIASPGRELREQDLGNIAMQVDPKYLSAVTVVGQKPALELGVDRKSFNVDKSITSTGGTAIDVMKNIPSVSVDVDGNVSLRSNTPQIFVDGLPTILTLDQIPADNIERIELFTNPSAKFDASSRGGIINIILKKNRKMGLNGIVSAGAGHPSIVNSNVTLNLRQGKFNFFVSGSYNQGGGRAKGITERINKSADTIQNYFNQYSWTERMRRFGSIRFGFDLFADNRNTITIAQNFVKGRFTGDEEQQQEYFSKQRMLERTGERTNFGRSENFRSNTQLSYKYKFSTPGKELTADVNYNTGKSDDGSDIMNSFFLPDGSLIGAPAQVRNRGNNDSKQFTFQADFINPRGENAKIEMGVRSFLNDFRSNFNSFAISNGGETKLPLSNNYTSREMVNAAYITYSNRIKTFAYQAGLRFEHSEFTGELLDSAREFGYKYPSGIENIFDALFPSVFLTKTIAEETEIQLNYTRRVRRPNFWQLNPFININDPVNLEQGNPQLQPEFTNSIEFNFSKTYNTGNFLGVLYFQNNERDITRYSDTISAEQYQQLNNAAVDPNAILNTFINARSTNRLGMELTWQQNFGKFFDITPSVDLQYRKVNVDQYDLSNEGFNWEAQLIANYRIETKKKSLFNKLSFQVQGEYESPEVTPQGKNLEQYSVDFAMRKDFLKGNKGSLTFAVNDVFNSRRWGSIYDTDDFFQESYRRRNVRSFRISFTYRFGKSDFNLFRRGPERRNGDDEEGGDNGNGAR
jgi:outer membrane receptor protein involved in Fe transport